MKRIILALCCSLLLLSGCGKTPAAPGEGSPKPAGGQVASGSELAESKEVVDDSMTPVYADELLDGVYDVVMDSSSSMFRIEKCTLTVSDGKMEADMAMGGTGYQYIYLGTGEEAVAASSESYIPYKEIDGVHHFSIPIEALDQGISCCAFSKKKQKWYDRTLVVRADSLPLDAYRESPMKKLSDLKLADGVYEVEVTLEGGSGKAGIQSPARLTIQDQKATVRIHWSSPNYDYMLVDGEKYLPVNEEGNSEFEIPVDGFDYGMPVIADTTAMSTPHEIQYTLYFDSSSVKLSGEEAASDDAEPVAWSGVRPVGKMELAYATEFSATYYEDGYALVQIEDGNSYLIIPENHSIPTDLPSNITIIQKPLQNIYLAASSAMDLFDSLDALSAVSMTSTKAEDWSMPAIGQAVKNDEIAYVGKYNAPDYEYLLSEKCSLAIESTMIYHNPQTKEKLEALGIPVLVERSSYESHPLGRLEWIRLYGLLLGREQKAEDFFQEKRLALQKMEQAEPTGKTVAFFYLTSQGLVNVRKPGDYISKMISLAGGKYILKAKDLKTEENALSTMNLQMESFYQMAKDADILIYNSTIEGELDSIGQLLGKEPLFADFKAVKTKKVYCARANMFQETSRSMEMIQDLYDIIHETAADSMTFLKPL